MFSIQQQPAQTRCGVGLLKPGTGLMIPAAFDTASLSNILHTLALFQKDMNLWFKLFKPTLTPGTLNRCVLSVREEVHRLYQYLFLLSQVRIGNGVCT